jgi:hypothetical protein
MKRKLKSISAAACLTLLTGCSIAYDLVAPVANFGLGLYNADTYVTKDCQWYEPVWFSKETKEWLKKADPPPVVISDIGKVSYNNDLALELCEDKEKEK